MLVPPSSPVTGERDGLGLDRYPSSVPTVLVTNDDGVTAPGLAALAAAAAGVGHVVVAAPADDRSGAGAAVAPAWLDEGIVLSKVDVEGLGPAWSVHGPPALAVLAGVSGGLCACPRLVVSGINRGPNTGLGILHSGTVGAALTAGNLGLRALAVSIDSPDPRWYETAARVAAGAMAWLLDAPPGTVLNINVPDLPLADLRGVREATLARFGSVEATLHTGHDHKGPDHKGPDHKGPDHNGPDHNGPDHNGTDDKGTDDKGTQGGSDALRLRLTSSAGGADGGSDAALVAAGFVTVTCVVGVRFGGWTGAAGAISDGLRSRTGSRAGGRS